VALPLGSGCNMLSLPFFLFGPEPKVPPILKGVAAEDKKKEIKVAVLTTFAVLEMSPELMRADRELSEQLCKHLGELCKYNEENVTILSSRKVEEYKNQHPDWKSEDLDKIGKALGVDDLIFLEIEEMTLYQKQTFNTLFQGCARISVKLIDVHNPEEVPADEEFQCIFPTETHGSWTVDSASSIHVFRQQFLSFVGRKLSWRFSAHLQKDDYKCE